MIIRYAKKDINREKGCETCNFRCNCHLSCVEDLDEFFSLENCKKYSLRKIITQISFEDEELEKEILDLIETKKVKYERIED